MLNPYLSAAMAGSSAGFGRAPVPAPVPQVQIVTCNRRAVIDRIAVAQTTGRNRLARMVRADRCAFEEGFGRCRCPDRARALIPADPQRAGCAGQLSTMRANMLTDCIPVTIADTRLVLRKGALSADVSFFGDGTPQAFGTGGTPGGRWQPAIAVPCVFARNAQTNTL